MLSCSYLFLIVFASNMTQGLSGFWVYTVHRGLINWVYGIVMLKYGLTTNFDITNSTFLSILGVLGDFLGILGPFWGILVSYPPPPPPPLLTPTLMTATGKKLFNFLK